MPVWVTYDSGTDRHYLNKTDRVHAGLPILKPPTKRVGVANGGASVGTHVTHLKFHQISHKESTTDTFTDSPNFLMSVGNTADDNTISVFTKYDVKFYYKEDVLITCKNNPVLIRVCNISGLYCILLQQRRGQWQPCQPSKKAKKALRQSKNMCDLPSTEQSIKCMNAVCGYPVKTTCLKAVK